MRSLMRFLNILMKIGGEKVTKVFVKKVYDFLDIIVEFPQIGTVEHKVKGIRGFTLIKQINVFYVINEDKIVLLDFFDNRKDPLRKRF